jgi:hypothetical protein
MDDKGLWLKRIRRSSIISAIISVAEWVGENMVGDYIVGFLKEHNIALANLFGWISSHSILSSGILFLIVLIILLMIDVLKERKNNNSKIERKEYSLEEYEDELAKINNHPRIGILVRNDGSNDLVDCWARLTSLVWLSPSGKESQERINRVNPLHLNLSWAGIKQKEFRTIKARGGEAIIDLAELGMYGLLAFIFFGKSDEDHESGVYKIKVELHLGDTVEIFERTIEAGETESVELHGMKVGGQPVDKGVTKEYKYLPYLIFKHKKEHKQNAND